MGFMDHIFTEIPNLHSSIMITRCGYTGEDGFEISIHENNIEKFVDFLLKNPLV